MATPEMPNGFDTLQMPDDQIKRQAISSLRGYIYQIYQSLNAWITIEEDQILLLEVAEDFAVLAKNALKGVQVKDTASTGSVTLKTDSVADTIKSLWQFQQANTDKDVSITYLTTSEIGKEQKTTFPDNQNGLTYWRIAAREGADVEPIRQVLSELGLPSELLDFINTATPDELREKILRKITWACGEKDIETLRQTILDRLVYFGNRLGFTATDSEKAHDLLVVEILEKIIDETSRQLSKADLLRFFEKAVSVSMPTSAVRELLKGAMSLGSDSTGSSISATDIVIHASRIPLSPRLVNRQRLVDDLVNGMVQSGTLWLHGSSGTGKTVLAQFIARRSKYDWLVLQLRDCPASEIDFRLCRALQVLRSGNIGGIILDDLPTKHLTAIRLRLSMLVNEIHQINGTVVVTSAKSPSPTIQSCLGENGLNIVEVPYLSKEAVAELVKSAGGDEKKWAGVVHAFCGGGHPQLVQARIIGLQQRNWPESELLNGMPGFGELKEIKNERDSIRERLLAELTPNARDLLYRLTLLVGYFDREMAIAIGEVAPAINCPGEVLDTLIGPWIEMLVDNRFRISPLVSNAGIETLSKSVQTDIHKKIVDHLIVRRPFPGDFLGTFLSHALASRHAQGLMWLNMAIMRTPDNDKAAIAEHLYLLPLLDTGKILFEENIHISAMLRLAQFRVAAWAHNTTRLPDIADQLIAEARLFENKEAATGFLCLVIISVLMEQSLRISPLKWIPLLQELEQTWFGSGKLAQFIRENDPLSMSPEKWTTPQFIFILRATSLKSITELIELFSELNKMESQKREAFLALVSKFQSGTRLMIYSTWLTETRQKDFDAVKVADTFRQLAEIAGSWGNIEIAVECECARSIMFDEYANDRDSALASLDEADKKYPQHIRLVRRRAGVYYRGDEYQIALETIEDIVKHIPENDHIERAFALREAGVSAAKIENYIKSSHYFSEACKAASASTDNMHPMAIGLKVDNAISQFQLGNKVETLNLMREALTSAEQIKPEMGKHEKYCIISLGQAIFLMEKHVKIGYISDTDIRLAQGYCSNPEPPENIMELSPTAPLVAFWYILAFLEAKMGVSADIIDELRSRTQTKKILSCEFLLNYSVMSKYITGIDVESFFLYLPEYVSKTVYLREKTKGVADQNAHDLTNIDFPMIDPVDWVFDPHIQHAKDATLSLVAMAISSNVDIKEQLHNHVNKNQSIKSALSNFLDCFDKETYPDGDEWDKYAFCLGYLTRKTNVNPDSMFILTYNLWQWLLYTDLKGSVEDEMAHYLSDRWLHIVKHQRFNLLQPMIVVPDIKAVIDDSSKGTVKIARLLLAAEIAVSNKLDSNQRSNLKKHCA